MTKTIAGFSMSLDGYIAGLDDDVAPLYKWFTSGDTDFTFQGADQVYEVASESAELLSNEWSVLGAMVTGRRDFDASDAWGGKPPLGIPFYIVTHKPPEAWLKEDSPFIFVTDGVESAIKMAKKAAGEKHVAIGGSQIVQQSIKAGLLDEIYIDLAPILLGEGISLFNSLGAKSVNLEIIRVVDTPHVTHLRYRVLR
jgi:dihydrofolate reductase